MQVEEIKPIVEAVPLFKSLEEKEKFLIVISGLKLRLISLSKAAEIMNMSRNGLLDLLAALDVDYSFLSPDDIESEKTWPDECRS